MNPLEPHDIYGEALLRHPDEREAFVRACCGEDAELAAKLLELLEDDDGTRTSPGDGACREPEAFPSVPGYVIDSLLGRGGMGVVYAALEEATGRRVALKMLPAGHAGDGREIERLRREGRVLASLGDRRFAVLYQVAVHEGRTFLVMELVEGESLHRRLGRGPLPPEEALLVGRDIATALAIAHGRGIVHRDLKPSNIMLSGEGARLLDFGIARRTDEGDGDAGGAPVRHAQADRSLCRGTPAYMSPELLPSPAGDLYSFGCVLFEMLTGARAVRCGHDLTLLPATVPGAVRRLISRCLDENPGRRPESAAEVARALDGELGRKDRLRRHVAIAVLIVAVAAVSVVTGLGLSRRPGPAVALVRADSVTVRAVDARGRERWSHEFDAPLRPNTPHNEDGDRPAPDAIMSRHGVAPLGLLATRPYQGRPGMLWCCDLDDGRMAWTAPLRWKPPRGSTRLPEVRWIAAVPWSEDTSVFAAQLADGDRYPSSMQFIDDAGLALATYYHPGWLYLGGVIAGQDGRKRLLLYGSNSSARFDTSLVPFATEHPCGTVVLLDLPNEGGQAFPWSLTGDRTRDWPGMPRAAEPAVLVIPPAHPTLDARVEALDLEWDGAEPRIRARLADRRRFLLGAMLEPLELDIVDSSVSTIITSIPLAEQPALHWRHGATVSRVRVDALR